MADLAFAGVTKRFPDGTEAVTDLDLEVHDGECMVLVGPSGCGKTTALRMLAGLEGVSRGAITIDGEVVNDRQPRERNLAMVFQQYALYPHMTVRQNIGFPLKLSRIDKASATARIEQAAALLDLRQHLDRKPAQLSGGQRQRVAMGRAIVREPGAFLMDEPLSNLDAKLRVQMRASIARLQDRLGATTVYVTHDQTEAMTLGDRIAIMNHGVLQQVGAPGAIYDDPANVFVAGFVGSPSMNLLRGRIEEDALRLGRADVPLEGVLGRRLADGRASRDVVVGIRPEDAVGDGGTDGVRVSARAELVESVGSDVYAYLSLDGMRAATPETTETGGASPGVEDLFVARMDRRSRARRGDTVDLSLDPSKLHVFDAGSGESLTPGSRG